MTALLFSEINEIEVNELDQDQIQVYLQKLDKLPLYDFPIEKQLKLIALKIKLIRELRD